jgi:hypothetical protein
MWESLHWHLCSDTHVIPAKIVAWAGVHMHDQYATLFWSYYTTVYDRYVPCWTDINQYVTCQNTESNNLPLRSKTLLPAGFHHWREIAVLHDWPICLGEQVGDDVPWPCWPGLIRSAVQYYIHICYIYIYIIYSMGICSRINGSNISIYPMDICWFICMELMDILVDIYGNLYCRVAGWPMVQTNEALTRTGASRPGSSQVTSCRILRSFWRLAGKWGDN